MRSSAPSCCFIFLDSQVQRALCYAVLHSVAGTVADLGLCGKGASEPDSGERKMAGCGLG